MLNDRLSGLVADLNGTLHDIKTKLERGELSPSQALREAKRAESVFYREKHKLDVIRQISQMQRGSNV